MNLEERTLDLEELHELGRQLLVSGRKVNFSLGGNSMFPYLRNGDVATVVRLPIQDLKLGQVVVFEQQGKWIAHRLVSILRINSEIALLSQGDSIVRSDKPIGRAEYLGVVESFSRNGKRHQMTSFLVRKVAWVMIHVRPFPQYIVRLYLKIKRVLTA